MLPKQTLVSVIVPCYNQGKYLNDCLQSVFEQTHTIWECIIVNDGSTDNTEEIALEWCKKDPRFKYLKKENGGLSSARNAGLAVTKGEFIQFLDCDDFINKFKFEKQLKCFSHEIDIVICDYVPFDQTTGAFLRGRYLPPFPSPSNFKDEIIQQWEASLSIPCHCIIFKSRLLKNDPPIEFEESLPNHEDWAFWVRLFSVSKRIYNLSDAFAYYRIHNSSMSSDQTKMKEGFIMACKSNISFFHLINNKAAAKQCQEKLSEIIGKKSKKKRIFKLFIPPIFFIVLQKIKGTRKEQS